LASTRRTLPNSRKCSRRTVVTCMSGNMAQAWETAEARNSGFRSAGNFDCRSLVDSSVWIDYFRGAPTPQAERLDALLGTDPLAVGDLIPHGSAARLWRRPGLPAGQQDAGDPDARQPPWAIEGGLPVCQGNRTPVEQPGRVIAAAAHGLSRRLPCGTCRARPARYTSLGFRSCRSPLRQSSSVTEIL